MTDCRSWECVTGIDMSNRFTQYILIAMALGIVMGSLVFSYLPDSRGEIAADVNLVAMLFLRLIKMIIAPLVFATLVGGIAHMGSGSKLGRIFAKTMGWFISASFISLLLGLVMVNLLQPGANFPGTLPAAGQSTGLPTSAFSIEKFLTHLIPTSIADAMAQNEILQIVIFAVFFAVAMGAMPERSKPMLALIDDLGHIMLKVTGYVMKTAPLAIFAALAATIATQGIEVLWTYVKFISGFYLSLASHAGFTIDETIAFMAEPDRQLERKCRELARSGALSAERVRMELLKLLVADAAQALLDAAVAQLGKIDILINNAGILRTSAVDTFDLDELEPMIAINYTAVVRSSILFARHMKAHKTGQIVNLSSILASNALHSDPASPIYNFKVPAYNVSKTALNGWTVQLAYELRDTNIKVNSAHPGHVQTDMGGPEAPMAIPDGAKTSVELALLPADGPNDIGVLAVAHRDQALSG
eukprot:gene34332-46049_t